MAFRLWSNDLKEGQRMPAAQVFNGFGHSGGNISPHLAWDGAPEGTKSFLVSCYDPDAPTGSGWWHWGVINIAASTKELVSGAGSADGSKLPKGAVQTRTDFGTSGYGGAAPPPGPNHHYTFTIFAMKVDKLDLDANASGAMVGYMANFNSLAKATLMVTYSA
jgi:Raf kinase inhibitor-like YbhB/YbcL family protein